MTPGGKQFLPAVEATEIKIHFKCYRCVQEYSTETQRNEARRLFWPWENINSLVSYSN